MPYVPFRESFPKISEKETRSFTIVDYSDLPPGSYVLLEMYCDEPGCDCRRVFLNVIATFSRRTEAVIAYGWESAKFYAQWIGNNDPMVINELKGPILNLGSPQSKLAPAILKFVKDVILQDQLYIERLKSHYKIFRDKIDNKKTASATKNKKGKKA